MHGRHSHQSKPPRTQIAVGPPQLRRWGIVAMRLADRNRAGHAEKRREPCTCVQLCLAGPPALAHSDARAIAMLRATSPSPGEARGASHARASTQPRRATPHGLRSPALPSTQRLPCARPVASSASAVRVRLWSHPAAGAGRSGAHRENGLYRPPWPLRPARARKR